MTIAIVFTEKSDFMKLKRESCAVYAECNALHEA